MAEIGSIRLEAIEGPEDGSVSGPILVAPKHSATIGRARDCQVCLPDATVSRHHATVAYRGGRWFLSDLGSKHGTILNAVELESGSAHPLDVGDLLRIGPWTFRVSIVGREPSTQHQTIVPSADDLSTVRVTHVEASDITRHRLHLLLDGAARINSARDENELAEAVVDSVLAGTAYERAALIRHAGDTEQVEILSARCRHPEDSPEDFNFSSTLVHAAAGGQMMRLTSMDESVPMGVSIVTLGITDALCAPIFLGGAVVAYLYLDARGRKIPAHDDAADFCEGIARMCGLALANLKRVELERRQRTLESEIEAARTAQKLIVPAPQNALAGLTYSMHMQPGSIVAGDLFDIVVIDDARIGIVVGDVTGEGIGAALIMASAQAHLHSMLMMHGDPAAALNSVNAYICERSPLDKYISMWVGVYDRTTNVVQHVDAGHGHWLIRRADGTIEQTPLPNGTLVGIDETFRYGNRPLSVHAGDRLILFSDGIVEQMNDAGEQFRKDRVALQLHGSTDAADDVRKILDAVLTHAGVPQLADDATVASIAFE